MKRIIAICLFIIGVVSISPAALMARTKVVSTEYIYHVPEDVSIDRAKETALARAQAQAIADEFGTIVNQSTSITVDTQNDKTRTDFLSLGGSELKGEWLETIGEPIFEQLTDGNNLAIRVRIKGRIRELSAARAPVVAKILCNGVLDMHESDHFMSGDDLYISFLSPVDGYIAIYLIDTSDHAFCLLPYQAQSDGIYKTKANKKYLFFHPDHCVEMQPEDVDRLEMCAEKEQERNKVYVIFSPNKFFKGVDSKIDDDLPRSMSYSNFAQWLSNLRKKDPELTITEKAILIHPSN